MSDVFISSLNEQTFGLVSLPPTVSKMISPGLFIAPPLVTSFGGSTLKTGVKREWIHFLFNGSKRLPGTLSLTSTGGFKILIPDKSFATVNHHGKLSKRMLRKIRIRTQLRVTGHKFKYIVS